MTTPVENINTSIPQGKAASISQLARALGKGQKVVGYSCPCVPEELIMAAGMMPLRVPFGDQDREVLSHLDAFCRINPCEMPEQATGSLPVFSLEIPLADDDYDSVPPAAASFKQGLKALRHQLENFSGKKIKDGDILKAIRLCREIRENLRTLFEYPQSDASPIEWRGLFEFTQTGYMTCRPDFLAKTEKLDKELNQKIAGGIKPDARPRLMICGAALGADDGRILDLIEEAGGRIVADCLCNGAMLLRKRAAVFGLFENPLDTLAELYLYNVPGPCRDNMPRRINYILKTIRDFRVHGLIYYSGQGKCNPLSPQVKPIKERIYKDLLVPTLVLGRASTEEEDNSRARLNSFIDIVGGRI